MTVVSPHRFPAGTDTDTGVDAKPGPRRRTPRGAGREILLIVVLYAGYSFVRGQFGSASQTTGRALANADAVMALEQRLGIFNELTVQQWFLHWPALARPANIFYGVFHLAVPVIVLVLLYRRAPSDYGRWRNRLVATTVLALVGFSVFPLMPPRLLCDCPLGSGAASGFVDTLGRYGGLWSFTSHGVGAVANQYAAMPSLHFAWSLWCACALFGYVRHRFTRVAIVLYPMLTVIVVVVTANHFWLDALGGAAVFGAGVGAAALIERGRGRLSKATRA